MNLKKVVLILTSIFIVLVVVLSILARRLNTNSQAQEKNVRPTIASISPTTSITQSPPDIDPTIAAIPAQNTGGNMAVTLTTSEQAFSDLFFKVPLDMQTFMVDFDYADNKFSILILNDAGEDAYHKWRKDTYPALTDEQFVINDKRI